MCPFQVPPSTPVPFFINKHLHETCATQPMPSSHRTPSLSGPLSARARNCGSWELHHVYYRGERGTDGVVFAWSGVAHIPGWSTATGSHERRLALAQVHSTQGRTPFGDAGMSPAKRAWLAGNILVSGEWEETGCWVPGRWVPR